MNRPIKFMVGYKGKLYEAPLVTMITSEDFTATCGLGNKFSAEEGASLYEYTGLLDKDGEEIYEGHIIQVFEKEYNEDARDWLPNEKKPFLFKVIFEVDSGGALGSFEFEAIGHERSCIHLGAHEDGKIIGHIAEEKK